MKSTATSRLHKGRQAARRAASVRGFVLLEIIFALALFAMVAVSMTKALDQIAKASKASEREGQVMRVLESVLAEVVHQPELKVGGMHFDVGGDQVEANASISHIDLYTRNKARLDHMFEIRVTAWVAEGRNHLIEREMRTYVYSPNSPEK